MNKTVKMFEQLKAFESLRASKDNCYGDAMPVTNLVVSKLKTAAALLEDVSRITSASGVVMDPEIGVIHLITE